MPMHFVQLKGGRGLCAPKDQFLHPHNYTLKHNTSISIITSNTYESGTNITKVAWTITFNMDTLVQLVKYQNFGQS